MSRIYLDNAATSWPKPVEVWNAVDQYQRANGAAMGRGGYRSAMQSSAALDRCRARIAHLLNCESPERIALGLNGTDALNIALHGLLRPGDRVVTTALEHNSVLRPLRELAERLGVEIVVVPGTADGSLSVDAFRTALAGGARLAAFLHASNVSGAILPVMDLAEMSRTAGALVLVDAAQSAGHVPIDLAQLPVDLLACSGHKGLLGPLGTGVLYVRPGVEFHLRSFRQGGTGSLSEDSRQPAGMPDQYEAGNHNAPGIVGLEAGVEWVLRETVAKLHAREQDLIARLADGLAGVPGLTLWGPPAGAERVGVLSLSLEGYEPHDLCAILDDSFQIEARAGLHCAPGAHRTLGTFARGGTLRLSVGPFTTIDDIDATIAAIAQLANV